MLYIYIIYTYTHVRENYVNTYDSRDSFPRLVLATTTTDSSRQFYAVSLFRSLPFFLLVSSGYSIRDKSRQTDRIFHTPSFESLDRYFDSKFVKSVGEVRVKGSKRGGRNSRETNSEKTWLRSIKGKDRNHLLVFPSCEIAIKLISLFLHIDKFVAIPN